jgi:hypothetical protein
MEKNRFKQLLESKMGDVRPLIREESNTSNFLLRRWDFFKERFDWELKLTGGVCHFKKNDDFDGYFTHMTQSVLKSMFIHSVPDLGNATKEDLIKFVAAGTEAIRDNFMDDVKKHYESTDC